MKKKVFLLVMGLSCFQILKAQQQTYTISNDQSKEQNLLVGISLLDFTLGSAALSFSGGADADFFFNRMSVEAGFRFSYYDLKKSLMKATNESSNNLKGYKDIRVGGRLHFIDKEGSKKMKANISFEQNGSTSKTTYLPVMVPTRKIIALHFGLQHYNSPVKARRDKTITATDGTSLSEWQSGTNMGITMLYGGFSFINIMKATVNSKGDTWNFKWAKNIYFDALYAPLIRIQDITVANKTYDVKGTGAKGFETSPVGGRFGVASMASKAYIKYEIGWYPGLANRGLFTQATFGLSLIRKVKIKA